jgi:hypothetical protein
MKPEEKALLTRCLALQAEIEASEPEEWKSWERRPWEQQYIYGPAYFIGQWFGPLPERMRMRYRRALDVLAEAGLVELHREYGVRLTNVKLTEAGEVEARKLAAEATYGICDTAALCRADDGNGIEPGGPVDA